MTRCARAHRDYLYQRPFAPERCDGCDCVFAEDPVDTALARRSDGPMLDEVAALEEHGRREEKRTRGRPYAGGRK